MSNQPLIVKYRPRTFEEMLGHGDMLAALLRAMLSPTCPHTYLCTGPSGIGKTTIARIIASELGAEVLEIDAASNSGVDATREIVELGQHMSLSGAGLRMIIIDEAHTLSKNAWQALLKLLEEPPDHLFIALCTTELDKVPETIRTRCFHVVLKPLHPNDISDLISLVSEMEGWTVHPDVHAAIVQAATGQPRKALAILDVAHDAPSRDEVLRIVSLQDTSEPILELVKYLLGGGKDWPRIAAILGRVDDGDYDKELAGMARYIISVMLSSQEKQASIAWELLNALTFPVASFERKAVFFAAIGRIVWGG